MKITLKDSEGKWVDVGWEAMDETESKNGISLLFWIDTEYGESVTFHATSNVMDTLFEAMVLLREESKEYIHDTD